MAQSSNTPLLDSGLYLGIVYDAMRAMGHHFSDFYINIKPQAGYSKLVHGPAFTTRGRVVDDSEDYARLDNIRLDIYKRENFTNNPIVVLAARDDVVAHSGDITSQIYQTLGAKGFITDGIVRDIERIDALNFPCFCQDVNPIDALDYWALTEFDIPVEINGVDIAPADYLFASRDGIIRVKKAEFETFKSTFAPILEKENNIRAKITAMADAPDFTAEFEAFVEEQGRW